MVKKLKPDAPDPPGQFHQQQQEQIQPQQQQQQQENFPDDWARREFFSLLNSGPQFTAQDSRPSSTLQNTPQQTSQAIQSQPLSHQANQLPAQITQTASSCFVPTPPQNYSMPFAGANAQYAQLQYVSPEGPQQQQYSGQNQPSFRIQYSLQPQTNGGAINSLVQPVSGNSPSLVQPVSRPGGSQALFTPHNIGVKRPNDCEQYGAPLKCTATSPLFPQDPPVLEAPRGPPVAQFPQRNIFEGNYGFKVTFPGNSPRFIVSNVGDRRHINTEKNNYITVIIHHSADQRASLRFFIVFSRDSDTAQPVLPCKNHQNANHPNHMLEVSAGNGEARWDYNYHPSVVVTPAPASPEEYNVQLKFLCRNSCLTRKDLMLICQLERDGVVEGRECLDVKVSACPRRDVPKPSGNPSPSKMPREDHSQGIFQEVCSGLDESMVTVPTLALTESTDSTEPAFRRAQEFGILSARLSFIEQRFKELHPDEYEEAKEQFNTLWDSRMQKS